MPSLLAHLKSNAVAYLALFVALGGTGAYAANTVFSTDIVDGQVKSADLASNAVTSGKIKNATIAEADLAPGSVTAGTVAGDALGGDQIDESTLATVPDAGLLDGLDSSAFLRGAGSAVRFNRALFPGTSTTTGGDFVIPGFGTLKMSCPDDPTTTITQLVYTATASQTVYMDDGRTHPVVQSLGDGGQATNSTHNFGDLISIHATHHLDQGVMTLSVGYTPFFSVIAQDYRCRVSAQALVTP